MTRIGNSIPVITVLGKSGSGKTTLLEKLIAELRSRRYRVGTVKHHSHSGFEIDIPGKDSWRHAQAGSQHVVIAAPNRIAFYQDLERELELDEIIPRLNNVDIILVEGYKNAGKPTLEIFRSGNGTSAVELEAVGRSEKCFAVATDIPLDRDVPVFDLNDSARMVDLIETKFLRETNG